jgi:hypothetical protein
MKVSKPRGAGQHAQPGRTARPGPFPRWLRRAVAIVGSGGVAAASLLTGTGSAADAQARAQGQPAAPAASAAGPLAAAGHTRTVTLINGDRVAVTVTRSAALAGAAVRAAGGGINRALVRLNLAGKDYAVPADALPYLNRGLSPGLFELNSLVRLRSGARLPVQVGYRGAVPSLPGVTITSSGGGTARGYLTAASAAAFGAALARQFVADHARGSYGTDGMFAGGVSIGLPGQAPAPVPLYPMHTLTVTGTNLAGQPDTGDFVDVFSVDSLLKFADPDESGNIFYQGTAKFSVPAGHYMAEGFFFDVSGTTITAVRIVVLPQFTVTGGTTVALNEQTAANEVQMVTPRPAVTQDLSLDLHRVAANGDTLDDSIDAGNTPLWLNQTTQPVTVGTLQTVTTGYLTSPAGASQPYQYNLAFAGPSGLIGPQQYLVTAQNTAAVRAPFYQDGTSAGAWAPLAAFGFQLNGLLFGGIYPFSLPWSGTQYFSAGPAVFWLNEYWQSFATLSGGQSDAVRTFAPGEVTTQGWNAFPLHPTPTVNLLGPANPFPDLPTASRAGNTLSLDVAPFGDNTPGHTGSGFSAGIFGSLGTITGRYRLDQDGKQIAAGNAAAAAQGGPYLFLQARLSGRPATIRFALTATRTGGVYRLSTASRTVWTWRSARRPGARLPAGWICANLTQSCSVQPMLTLLYRVRGLAVDGSARPGRQLVQVTVGHLQLARAARITGVTAAASADGGRTWQPATVRSAGGGVFWVMFTAPPDARVSLRVHAADAAGSQITETTTDGYRTTAAAGPGAGPGARRSGPAAPGSSPSPATPPRLPPPVPGDGPMRAACPPPRPGHAQCFALYARQVRVNAAIAAGVTGAPSAPAGWGARDIESAYKLPVSRNPHQTVAVVDAYRTPALAANLAVYRKQYGLPACTRASGCLRIVNQQGNASPLPASGLPYGWDVETMLDVSMVSAACPHCQILVVEASSDSFADLAAAEDTAARLGAQVISNSYGVRENGQAQAYAAAYDHPGHTIVVSSGDDGFTAANFPANLATVTAAGGTELARAHTARGWSEQVWNTPDAGASGSGCSAYVAKPSWQREPHCPGRTVADVSALAWNVPIYEKVQGGWLTVGGTSAAAPLIAGVYGLAGNAATVKPGHPYARPGSLFDITAGNNDWFNQANGATCGYDYLCTAKKGYDAPTGLGTPDGTGAF